MTSIFIFWYSHMIKNCLDKYVFEFYKKFNENRNNDINLKKH